MYFCVGVSRHNTIISLYKTQKHSWQNSYIFISQTFTTLPPLKEHNSLSQKCKSSASNSWALGEKKKSCRIRYMFSRKEHWKLLRRWDKLTVLVILCYFSTLRKNMKTFGQMFKSAHLFWLFVELASSNKNLMAEGRTFNFLLNVNRQSCYFQMSCPSQKATSSKIKSLSTHRTSVKHRTHPEDLNSLFIQRKME